MADGRDDSAPRTDNAAGSIQGSGQANIQVGNNYFYGSQEPYRPTSANVAPSPNHNEPRCVVPFGRNKDFVGRQPVLNQLAEIIPPRAEPQNCQRTIIEGLGGVGKTQIALEAVFQLRDKCPGCSVYWVPAVDAATFENALREIGRQLKIPGMDNHKADIKLLVQTALRDSRGDWLLVIDNADDLDLLTSGTKPLCNYLPFSHSGSILFTTRNHAAAQRLGIQRTHVINIDKMSRPEAIDMLQTNLSAAQRSGPESTAKLLDFLADLPLAIKQASAYIDQAAITVAKYLEYCQSSDAHLIELLSKDFNDHGRYGVTKNPVATTWLISFEHISRDNPLAAQYLQAMSLLAEKDIPRSLLPPGNYASLDSPRATKFLRLESFLKRKDISDALPPSEFILNDNAIAALKGYGFIIASEGEESYQMHRLVRLAMRNWLITKRKLQICVTRVIRRLAEMYPFPTHENKGTWVRYLPHAMAALEFPDNWTNDMAQFGLFSYVAESYRFLGQYEQAQTIYQHALDLCTKVLGPRHHLTISTKGNLVNTLYSQGKYEQAEAIYRQTLELNTKLLGPVHPYTLMNRRNLAIALSSQGKYEEAETLCWQTLDLCTRALGPEHDITLCCRGNLASALNGGGKYELAETMGWQTLDLCTKVLGPEHPDTIANNNILGVALYGQGKYEQAETMHRRGLELCTKVLGPEHPTTLVSRNNLLILEKLIEVRK